MLLEWAIKHGVSSEAFRELLTSAVFTTETEDDQAESTVQRNLRLNAAELGIMLFRNNRGAGRMESGNYVRYGLANDSKKFGDVWKSGDLIGWENIVVTLEMVIRAIADGEPGFRVSRFTSVEVKNSKWRYSGTKEEIAQSQWAALVNASGGRAVITNDANYFGP